MKWGGERGKGFFFKTFFKCFGMNKLEGTFGIFFFKKKKKKKKNPFLSFFLSKIAEST